MSLNANQDQPNIFILISQVSNILKRDKKVKFNTKLLELQEQSSGHIFKEDVEILAENFVSKYNQF